MMRPMGGGGGGGSAPMGNAYDSPYYDSQELQRLMMRQAMPQPGAQPAMPPQGAPQAPQGAMQQGDQLDPAMVDAILAMNQQGAKRAGVQRSRMLADQLRADAGQQMQGRQAGRVYQGPGLANLAATVMAGYKARGLENDADVREKNLGTEQQAAMRRYFDALRGQRGQQPMPYMGAEGE